MKKDYLGVAILAAKEAGKIHRKYFNTNFRTRTKTTSFDLLTIADVKAESVVVKAIKKHFPGHNFLCEENKYKKTDSHYTWIIDPLDGTSNFASRLPIFCVSIALAKDKEVVVGVIYDAIHDELFYAQKGKGAFLNKKRIRVTNTRSLKQSLLITGFYYDRGGEMERNLLNIKKFFIARIRGLRRLGAAALDFCYVACGRASGFWEFQLSPWDFAAGVLLVREAGGKVTDQFGGKINIESSYIVASNGKIHNKMLKILQSRTV
ncbi:inositol monophosphatase family protein [Thermoproteota archaeon]